jgi:hypothetical protein
MNTPVGPDLARALLSLADTAEMPDTYWQTDSRVALAREVLGVPVDGRYTHAHLWAPKEDGDA